MALAREPDPEAIETEIGRVLAALNAAIEQSVLRSVQTLRRDNLPFDPTGHATLFRLHLRQFLQNEVQGIGQDLEVRDLENCGVFIRMPGFEFRVLKSANDGSPPEPGDSSPLLQFFNQIAVWQPRLPGLSDWFPESADQSRVPLHIILHWHTARNGEFIRARWACPKSATARHVEWYFNRDLPNPVLLVVAPELEQENATPSALDNLGFALRELPFTSDQEPAESEGDSPTQ